MLCLLCVTPLVCHLTRALPRLHLSSEAGDKGIVPYLHIHLFSEVLHRRRRVSPRRPMYLQIVVSDYCVCTCANRILSLFPACALSLSSLLQKSISTAAPRLPATKLICSNLNVYSGAAALSASMMLLCCSLALSSFVPRKSSFLSDKGLNSMMYSVQ